MINPQPEPKSEPKSSTKSDQTSQPQETPLSDLNQPLFPSQPPKSKDRRPNKILLIGLMVFLISIVAGSILVFLFAKPKIILQDVPASARIVFDGKVVSKTTITTSIGTHYLKITRPGYIPIDKQIKLGYFQRYRQDAQLRPIPQARQIVSQRAFSLSQDQKNSIYYLDGSNQVIYRIEQIEEGQVIKTALTPVLDFDLEKVIFSPDFSLAVFKLKNGQTGLYDFKRYDLLNQEYYRWGDNIGDVVWRQDGKKVLYWQELASGRKMLTLANKNNSNQQNLIFLDEYGIDEAPLLDWTNDQKTVLLVAGGSLYLFDVESRADPNLVVKDGVTEAKFTPNNQEILFTHNEDLKIVKFERDDSPNQSTGEIGKFSIHSIRKLGIKAPARRVIVSPDSQRIVAFAQDKGLVEIDLSSKKIRQFNYQDRGYITIESLQMSRDEKILFFLTQDKRLMSLPLDKGEY
jgi:hypothetical protein